MATKKEKTNWSAIGKRVKRRGKTYERRVAKILHEFTSIGFRSTPSSGGFNKLSETTIREELFCGDLICDNPNFRYCVEAKNREKFSFTAILKNPSTAAFTHWWHQCVTDAKNANLEPLMFFKPNRQDDFLVMTHEEYHKFYSSTAPYFTLWTYMEPIKLKLDKDEDIIVNLPIPIVIDWKKFVQHNNSKFMFKG